MISLAQKLKHTTISQIKARTLNTHASSDLHVIVSAVPIGATVDEIVISLSKDETCNSVKLTHQVFDELLHRFKDDWKSALGLFRWAANLRSYKHSQKAYEQTVDILGKSKEMDRMRSLLTEMRIDRGHVSVAAIAATMRRFSGAGKWEEAVRVFDDLNSLGLSKNTESMNLLLDSLCKANRVDKARIIYSDLKAYISPNVNTFNIFINGWCKVGRVEEAHWTIQEMKGLGFFPCVVSYSIIVKFHCLRGEFDDVYKVLDEMKASGSHSHPNVVTHTIVMSCLAKIGKFDEALRFAEGAMRFDLDVLFFNSLIYVLGKVGDSKEAIRIFEEEMPRRRISPNNSTFNTLIAIFCRSSDLKKAIDLVQKMENPDVLTYYPLMKSCFRFGKVDDLLAKLLDDMAEKHNLSLDLSGYTLLIHGLCRANRCDWASLLFSEMICRGLKPRYKTCRLLLQEVNDKRLDDVADQVQAYIKSM